MNWIELWTPVFNHVTHPSSPLSSLFSVFCSLFFSGLSSFMCLFIHLHEFDLNWCLCKNISVWFSSVTHVWSHVEAALVLVKVGWSKTKGLKGDYGSDSQYICPDDQFWFWHLFFIKDNSTEHHCQALWHPDLQHCILRTANLYAALPNLHLIVHDWQSIQDIEGKWDEIKS